MHYYQKLILFFFILLTTFQLNAEVLFEGYYKVNQFKKHIGFFISRYEIDSKNKQFKTTTFLKLGKNGVDLTESLQAVSTLDFKPVSYTYLALDSKKNKTIDAIFKDGMMTGMITENGEKKKLSKKISKDTFLSSSLYYIMLKSKDGLKTGVTFKFSAIAEEQAEEMPDGISSFDKKMVSQGSLQLLKIKNSFAGQDYENLITNQGQIISATIPATGIDIELTKNSAEATEGVKVSSGTLEKIFGLVPEGKTNILNSK